MVDLHNYKRRLERTLQRVKESKLSKVNKGHILTFHDFCFSTGLGIAKIERYVYDLFKFADMFKGDMAKATKQDLQRIVAEIEKKVWSPHTKHCFKIMIRKFYKFIEGIDEQGVYPEKVKWMHTNVKNSNHKLPEELLTEEEVKQIIHHAENLRNRALITILYESGCRISEIGLLKIKDVSFDEYGGKISVMGKTGARRIRFVYSVPYLQEWINKHPHNNDPNNYLWTNRNHREVLSYARISSIIKRTAEKAGIKKRIYPHLFRHSRATFLAHHLTEAQMKDYLGWTQSSKMAAIYVHLSGRDTDDAVLKMSGVKINKEQEKESPLKSKCCERCKTENETTNKFCKLCGFVLNQKTQHEILQKEASRKEIDNLMDSLIQDKEVMEILVKKIKEKSQNVTNN